MRKSARKPVEVPATVPASILAAFIGVSPQRVLQLVAEGRFPEPVSRGEFRFRESVLAQVEYLGKKPSANPDRAKNIARKEAAEAEDAELNTAKKAGRLVLRSDYLDNYADAIAQGVRAISRLEGLDTTQKEAVFAALRSVKLPELEGEE